MDAKKFNKIIRKIKDAKAFNVLYEFYYPKIVSHIYFKFRNKHLGEDVAQEFFMKLLYKDVNDYIKNPTAWVYVVCDNIAKDFLTKDKRYNLTDKVEESTAVDNVFEQILYGEYMSQINQMDESTKKIITMHFYEGYSLKEIADLLNINYNTVRQKCSRGLKKLRHSEI